MMKTGGRTEDAGDDTAPELHGPYCILQHPGTVTLSRNVNVQSGVERCQSPTHDTYVQTPDNGCWVISVV